MNFGRKPPTWAQVEQASKHCAGLILLTLELARWGARPQALAAILAILGVSEAARLVVKSRGGNGSVGGSTSAPSARSQPRESSHG